MKFSLFYADTTNSKSNCEYPHEFLFDENATTESVSKVLSHDYCCSLFRNNRRSISNFLGANCVGLDIDNDPDDPGEWVFPADVEKAFPDVFFVIHYSRNHMKVKNGRRARARFHAIFPIKYVNDAEKYTAIKRKTQAYFPAFDPNATDAARFFYGVPNSEVEIHEGTLNLTEFLEKIDVIDNSEGLMPDRIPVGSRNSTLSRIAFTLLKKYGNCEKSQLEFKKAAGRCVMPLKSEELRAIWHSANKGYENKVLCRDDYIKPESYCELPKYAPDDLTHLGESKLFAKVFKDTMRFSPQLGFICYNGQCWEASDTLARANLHQLTEWQMEESQRLFGLKDEYFTFARSMRFSTAISSVLKEVTTDILIKPEELDANGYLLCTPAGTVDLSIGVESIRENRASDFITKSTAVGPGDAGKDLWDAFLERIFCGDEALIAYVQRLCGIASLGTIAMESLIISFGNGRNGKSSFWGAIRAVLGSYADSMASDILMRDTKRNIYPELAELQGKRLVIAAETAENARLNEVFVKQLCSTDFIRAEKKYRDPFSYKPSHTVILFTNFLPKVTSTDDGIWRRLKIIPFDATIDGAEDIRNYGEFLVDNAGEAILSWIIEGAKLAISEDFKIKEPPCVVHAIAEYRASNDWFGEFVRECCEIGDSFEENSQLLYSAYRSWCANTGEFVHSTKDFYHAVEQGDYKKFTEKRERKVKGIRIREDFLSGESAMSTTSIL